MRNEVRMLPKRYYYAEHRTEKSHPPLCMANTDGYGLTTLATTDLAQQECRRRGRRCRTFQLPQIVCRVWRAEQFQKSPLLCVAALALGRDWHDCVCMPAKRRRMEAQTRAGWMRSCVKMRLYRLSLIVRSNSVPLDTGAMQSVGMAAPESNWARREVNAKVLIQIGQQLLV